MPFLTDKQPKLEIIRTKLAELSTIPARRRMRRAAFELEPLVQTPCESPVEVHFLTGKNYWDQTCFCAYSLRIFSDVQPRIVFHDDGTLEPQHAELLLALIPDSKLSPIEETRASIQDNFPRHKFPLLHRTSKYLMVMRKLTMTHAGSKGWKLFLDSDMLFNKHPTLLAEWLRKPQQPCHLLDIHRCYGYSDPLMSSLVQGKIPRRLNAGCWGISSEEIDWGQLESWAAQLVAKEGMKYLIEQAMTAMLLADRPCLVLPAKEYIVCPTWPEAIYPRAAMHHYAGDSRPLMIRYGWKRIRDQAARQDSN
jgi:hypothetical protein